jgi:hypothetical protein
VLHERPGNEGSDGRAGEEDRREVGRGLRDPGRRMLCEPKVALETRARNGCAKEGIVVAKAKRSS